MLGPFATDVANGTVARHLRIDVHDNDDNDNDNAWQRGPLWPHGMGPISSMSLYMPDVFSITQLCRKWFYVHRIPIIMSVHATNTEKKNL